MKKTIGIIVVSLLTVFSGVFLAANVRRALVKQTSAERPVAAPQQAVVGKKADHNRPLFYTSVGGSAPESPVSSEEARALSRYTIEVATLDSQAEADALLLKLKAKGISGFYTPTRKGGRVFYRVRLGLFSNAEDAQESLSKVTRISGIKGKVSKLN